MSEIAKHANALELLALQIKKLVSIFAAFFAYCKRLHLKLLAAQHLVNFDFNR